MTYFDTTLEAEPVAEQNNDPILPEERFIFELVGFERSQPDQWHKNGGIRWTFAVYDMDGHPFEFQDEHYMLWRTTNVNAAGKPLFTLGTQAHEFAQALLGRNLGVDDNFSISEMRGKRFSSQVVWQPKKTKPKEKAAVLASLRHIPMAPIGSAPSQAQVSADPTVEDVDRALAISKLEKKVARATKKKLPDVSTFQQALDNVGGASLQQIEAIIESLDDALDKIDD